MNPIEKLTELLTNKTFEHNGKKYYFLSCKIVASNLMILTNQETLQIAVDRFADFYKKVASNCAPITTAVTESKTAPARMIHKAVVIPETPKTFEKLNASFEALIDALTDATEENIGFLEAKAKMITSIGQTAVNMENSRINLIKILNNN